MAKLISNNSVEKRNHFPRGEYSKASEATFAGKQLGGGHLLSGIRDFFIDFSHISQKEKQDLFSHEKLIPNLRRLRGTEPAGLNSRETKPAGTIVALVQWGMNQCQAPSCRHCVALPSCLLRQSSPWQTTGGGVNSTEPPSTSALPHFKSHPLRVERMLRLRWSMDQLTRNPHP